MNDAAHAPLRVEANELGAANYSVEFPLADVDKMTGHGGGGGHGGRDQMRAAPLALPAFEIAVAGRGTALAGRKLVGIHGQAHAAARLAPFEAGFAEDAVEPFGLGLLFHLSAARHDHRVDRRSHVIAAHHGGRGPQIFDPAVGAGADEHSVELEST